MYKRQNEHRVNLAPRRFPLNAVAARPVRKDEIAKTPKAQEAMNAEWDRLLKAEVWDTKVVREWDDVAAEAIRNKRKFILGIFLTSVVRRGLNCLLVVMDESSRVVLCFKGTGW